MKHSRLLLGCLSLLSAGLFLVSCASSEEGDHGKPAPSSDDSSARWVRPQTYIGPAPMAPVMPQSH